jgi:hypothetical protein
LTENTRVGAATAIDGLAAGARTGIGGGTSGIHHRQLAEGGVRTRIIHLPMVGDGALVLGFGLGLLLAWFTIQSSDQTLPFSRTFVTGRLLRGLQSTFQPLLLQNACQWQGVVTGKDIFAWKKGENCRKKRGRTQVRFVVDHSLSAWAGRFVWVEFAQEMCGTRPATTSLLPRDGAEINIAVNNRPRRKAGKVPLYKETNRPKPFGQSTSIRATSLWRKKT